jgi:uncharacterized membrane protein
MFSKIRPMMQLPLMLCAGITVVAVLLSRENRRPRLHSMQTFVTFWHQIRLHYIIVAEVVKKKWTKHVYDISALF